MGLSEGVIRHKGRDYLIKQNIFNSLFIKRNLYWRKFQACKIVLALFLKQIFFRIRNKYEVLQLSDIDFVLYLNDQIFLKNLSVSSSNLQFRKKNNHLSYVYEMCNIIDISRISQNFPFIVRIMTLMVLSMNNFSTPKAVASVGRGGCYTSLVENLVSNDPIPPLSLTPSNRFYKSSLF